MMKAKTLMAIIAAGLLLVACGSDSDLLEEYTTTTTGDNSAGGTSTSSASSTTTNSDLSSLDVNIDSTALAETETIPTDDEDYVENYTATKTIHQRRKCVCLLGE